MLAHMHPLLKPIREAVRPIKRAVERSIRKQGELITHPLSYKEDGLYTKHISTFCDDPAFQKAYQRGIEAAKADYHFRWRVHVALWAAQNALQIRGDFVECGVNRGFLSSAIMQFLDWNHLRRTFYLLDTFCGLVPDKLNSREIEGKVLERYAYNECFEEVQKNFSEFKRVRLIRGTVPETLEEVDAKRIAYLSLDMNCVGPEIAALEYFWLKLSPGAVVLMDDYGYDHTASTFEQKKAFDRFAKEQGTMVLNLPTGQGILIKQT